MQLTERQQEIVKILKESSPMTGEIIAQKLNLTRAALRADLTVLVMAGMIDARPRVGYYYVKKNSLSFVFDRIQNLKVEDYKSIPVIIKESAPVYDAVVAMFTDDAGSIFVVDDEGGLSGVVSRKDLLKTSLGQTDLNNVPVKVVMTSMPNIVTTTLDEVIYDAVKKIIDHQIDALPIVREKKLGDGDEDKVIMEVIGRFTKTNIANLFLDLASEN